MSFLIRSLHIVPFLQNFGKSQKLQYVNAASYQFKINKPSYYPDRRGEMQRINEQQKSQLVVESKESKYLPKYYYYKVLGLHQNASTQEIKAAYYKLAKLFHPDSANSSNNGQQMSKRFQEISNAYHILTDEAARSEYDQFGVVKDEKMLLDKANRQTSGTEYRINASNLLGRLERLSMRSTDTTEKPIVGNIGTQLLSNADQKLEISFLESIHGAKRNIDLKYLKKCPQCNGNSQRMAGRMNLEPCRKCNGSGQLKKTTPTYIELTPCDQCHGKRYINRNQCDHCDCRGYVQESNKITIHVPAGVKTGDIISVENPKTTQKLSYRITVKESDYYQRMGNNVITEKYVNLSEAILGCTVKIRGIYESLDLKIDAGTESHTKITMKGKGIRTRSDGVGDHIVLVKVRIPRKLTMKQRQLILALAKTEEPSFDRTI